MDFLRLLPISSSVIGEHRTRLVQAAFFPGGAVAVAGLTLLPKAGLLALGAFAALWFLAALCELFEGRIGGLLTFWAALFPLGSLIVFPRDRTIVTLDRAVLILAFLGLLMVNPITLAKIPRVLRLTGVAGLGFIAVAGITLGESQDVASSGRILFENFFEPFLFGWIVIAWFDVRRRLPALHTAVCISSIICALIAGAEIVTGEDLLPAGNSTMFYAGGIARPNGPFSSNDVLALVGGISLFLLLLLRAAMGPKVSGARRALHCLGLAAALGTALMPMFRSVWLTLLLVLIIDILWERRTSGRAWRAGFVLAFVGLIFAGSFYAPDVFADRSDAANLLGRAAQLEQSLTVFAEHPLLGVGFSNFNHVVAGEGRYRTSYQGVSSLDSPHNNLTQALAETGILGFVPYLMMHILLLLALWHLRKSSGSGPLVWKYFIYLFLTYWITGLTESSGFEALNIWYAFAIAVCYKFGLTAPASNAPAESELAAVSFSAPQRTFSPAFFR
jgi:O-antigen ligase